ncbi:MAG: hypothetical protein V4568_18830 [Pseudomonadota bacterium]
MNGLLWKALLVLAYVGYQFLVHAAFRETQGSFIHTVLLLLPLLALAGWTMTRSSNKPLWFFVLLASGLLVYLMEQRSHLGLVAAYGLPHAAANLALLFFFGRTLLGGREPLITRLARRVHGVLPLDMEIYTRRLTFIWCLFFAGQIITSVLLYRFASIDTWSLFINLLHFPLLAVMFGTDYLYRRIRFRHYPQASILKAIRAFAEDASVSDGANVR